MFPGPHVCSRVEVIPVSEPPDASMMNIVPMSVRRPSLHDDGFADLFTATYTQVVRTVWFVIHDQAAAEEVAQDAFIELFRGWSRLRDFDRPDLWVRRVAIRKAQREASRRTRRTVLEQAIATAPLLEDGLPLPDPDLIAAIRALPPKQRAIVVLFYLEDRPMSEVAELVGCSTSTGFVHLHKARRRLATALGEEVASDVD
jgi:RNA polymerase sigma-70 factor (ECF subfamily)